ncbi:MAG: DUF1566 domain-containing protein, partial [Desulfovibrionales bacterium]
MRWMITALLLAACCCGVAHAGLVDHGNGTVTDTTTGLMWQKCSYGQTWSNNGQCTGSATTRTWQQAMDAAETLSWAGHEDWRLPDINELKSLINTSY